MNRLLLQLGAVVGLCLICWIGGCTRERNAWKAKQDIANAVLIERAEGLERENKAIQETGERNARFIAGRYAVELARVSDRPVRQVEVIRSGACKGVSGAELARPDAGFLIGEAARADTLKNDYDTLALKYNTLRSRCVE